MALDLIRKAKSFDMVSVQGVRLHKNISFEKYFESYSRKVDGLVKLATYSFHNKAFSNMHRLMPFSQFYISTQHKKEAEKFFKRFPLYVVYEVEHLHTKCIYFERSRRLLLGSENLYQAESKFEELSCEIIVPNEDIDKVAELAFSFKSASYLRFKYELDDIKIYDSPGYVKGKLFLPCHRETAYWGAVSDRDVENPHSLNYIYVILQYYFEGNNAYLVFDRCYQYAGEISENVFNWVIKNFSPRRQDHVFLGAGKTVDSMSCFKDSFAKYHPIAKDNEAKFAFYLDNDDQTSGDEKVYLLKKKEIEDPFFSSVKTGMECN